MRIDVAVGAAAADAGLSASLAARGRLGRLFMRMGSPRAHLSFDYSHAWGFFRLFFLVSAGWRMLTH